MCVSEMQTEMFYGIYAHDRGTLKVFLVFILSGSRTKT
jgi:hypothetical protein